jgi:uncharacterized protein YbjT (DUF2867 family)
MAARSHLIVAVAGATGRFGGAARLLASRGHAVRALARDLSAPAAGDLRTAGIDVRRGDYDDPDGLAVALRGVDAVIASGTAHRAGPDGELRHGLALAAAVAEARVPQLVWISGHGADRQTGVPVLEAKGAVEERIAALGLGATILAPVYFMENVLNPWNLPAVRAGVLPTPVSLSRPLQQIAIADVVAFAVLAVEQRESFLGRRIELAADELTGDQMAASLVEVAGRRLEPRRAPLDALAPGLRAMFDWLECTGHDVDIAALHSRYPQIEWHDFRAWAAARDWADI